MKKRIFLVLLFQSICLWSQIALPIQQSNIPKNHLVVNYDFSNSASFSGTGTAVTNLASSTTGTATLFNSPGFIKTLGYTSFDGVNQYLLTPNLKSYFKSVTAASFQDSHTISLWLYPINSSGIIVTEFGTNSIGSAWQDSHIEMVNGYLKYRVWPGSDIITTTNTIAINQWHHIVMVYDGATVKGYVDGVLQGAKTYQRSSPINYGYDLHYGIGAYTGTNMGSSGYGKFHLAQFKMYNIPLNDTDVVQEYTREKYKYQYSIHSPSTNSTPSYWNLSSVWSGDTFNMPHYSPWLNSSLGWAAGANDTNQFIRLNYEEPVTMTGIVTQGRANGAQWVTSAHIDVSMNGTNWTRVVSNATLNSNYTDDIKVLFPTPVFAKYIRINPLTWINHITMRMGVILEPKPLVIDGLVLRLDAANLKSYSGTGTNWNDLSGNGNNGTLVNNPSYTFDSGFFGFNGSTSQVTIPDNTSIEPGSTDFTIEAWFYNSNTSGSSIILGKFNNGGASANVSYSIRTSNASLYAQLGDGTGSIINSLNYTHSANTWYQVVYVFKTGTTKTLETFINGTSIGTVSHSLSGLLNSTNPLYLGRYNGGEYAQNFTGNISNVRLYNKALSSTEVSTNFNAYRSRYGL